MFNLSIDLVKPLLCTFSLALVCPDLSLQFSNSILRDTELMRELLSHILCVSSVLLGYSGRFVKQMEYRLPALSSIIADSAVPSRCRCELNYCLVDLAVAIHGRIVHFVPQLSELPNYSSERSMQRQQRIGNL